jgi:hypothetical protein
VSDAAAARAWRRVALAAALTLGLMLALGLLLALAPAGVTVGTLQAAERAADKAAVVAAVNAAPGWAVAYFLLDSLFALAYLALYWSLRRALPGPVAGVALFGGGLKALADLTENGVSLVAALGALDGVAWSAPAVGLLLGAAQLKRLGGAIAHIGFAWALPPELPGALWLRLIFLLGGVAALLGYFLPALAQVHALLLFLTLPLLLWLARRERRHAA